MIRKAEDAGEKRRGEEKRIKREKRGRGKRLEEKGEE